MRRLAALGAILMVAGCAIAHGPTPAANGQKYVIFFQPFSANLDDPALGALKAAAESALAHPTAPVTVAGFASTIGSAQANAALSQTRAQVVSDGLVSDGVPAGRIRRKALGEVDYTLDPIEGRRVEISVGP
jgi:outer membrane protein OmpA-like peptidoglycan-associated protein